MPYNTRRKSLSLPSRGIHVPSSHPRPSNNAAAHSNSSNKNNNSNHSAGATSSTMPSRSPKSPKSPKSSSTSADAHPTKKVKRSHNNGASAPAFSTPSSTASKLSAAAKLEHTPPPSPSLHLSIEEEMETSPAPEMRMVDLEGINDEIVEAVIVQLQNSRNRPHLVKDLATVLTDTIKIVQQSANPCAIISSRLAAYLKRSCWSALAPCPLAKELETVHPRRTYFYLTTCPHQPLPDAPAGQRAIVTPSLSSSASTSEDADSADADRRRELSLSPEVDLSSPEFDDMEEDVPMPGTPMGSASVSLKRRPNESLTRSQRSNEPPLEKDEKEFTQTADGLQKRKLSGDLLSAAPVDPMHLDYGMQNEQLFGGETKGVNLAPSLMPHMAFITSPAMRPSLMMPAKRDGEAESWSKLDAMLDWDKSPETVELDELDGLLDDF